MFREMDVMDEWLGLGKPTSRAAMPWLASTIVLGCIFIAGQLIAWYQLAQQRVRFDNAGQSAKSFFLITGAHGAHLLLGVLALIGAFIGLFVSKQMERRQIMVDLSAWYWHSMGALWIVLFALLVFGQGGFRRNCILFAVFAIPQRSGGSCSCPLLLLLFLRYTRTEKNPGFGHAGHALLRQPTKPVRFLCLWLSSPQL